MKVSIITPTIRPDSLAIVHKSLMSQGFADWEWLIGSSFDPKIKDAKWIKDDFEGGFWSLNRMYNKLVSRSSGEIIITWQDWIYAKPDAVEKFVENVIKTNGVVSGVGDQFSRLNKWGKPEMKIWSDPRKTNEYGSFYECNWNDAEFNFAAFPKELFEKVGGFDEGLDFLGVGGDQLQLCDRLNSIGARFYLDQTNESYTLRHDRSDFGGQKEWDSKHVLFVRGKSGLSLYDERKKELIGSDSWPVIKNKDKKYD